MIRKSTARFRDGLVELVVELVAEKFRRENGVEW